MDSFTKEGFVIVAVDIEAKAGIYSTFKLDVKLWNPVLTSLCALQCEMVFLHDQGC